MDDISGYGLTANIVASNTFPQGFDVTQFADDADPFDFPEMKIADAKMGLNGDLITYSIATPIAFKIAVVPGSDDDANLAVLFEANRVGKNKQSAQDVISITGIYPQSKAIMLTSGKITDGPPASSVAAVGRLKSKTYSFMFENRAGNAA